MAAAATAAEEDHQEPVMPDPELLEFLGSFATDEGEWINPDSLLEAEFAALLDRASATFNRRAVDADEAISNNQESDND